jgi:hypothetical protein
MGKGESPPQRLSFFSHRVYILCSVCVCVFAFLHHPRKQLVNHKSHLRHRQRWTKSSCLINFFFPLLIPELSRDIYRYSVRPLGGGSLVPSWGFFCVIGARNLCKNIIDVSLVIRPAQHHQWRKWQEHQRKFTYIQAEYIYLVYLVPQQFTVFFFFFLYHRKNKNK